MDTVLIYATGATFIDEQTMAVRRYREKWITTRVYEGFTAGRRLGLRGGKGEVIWCG